MFYASHMVTTKQKHTLDSQKMKRRESKLTTMKIINLQRKEARVEERN